MTNIPNKTAATDGDVMAFVDKIEPKVKRDDTKTLIALFTKITGQTSKMWGPAIIGFGSYHYKYDSGREGDSPRSGFSPRKANIVLYLTGGYSNAETQAQMDDLRTKLGKHKVGKSCLYIDKISDIDLGVLEQMIRADKLSMDSLYPG
jgi:nucleoid DNA-binding protein